MAKDMQSLHQSVYFRGFTDICALCQDDIEDKQHPPCSLLHFKAMASQEGKRSKATCGHSFHRDCLQEQLPQDLTNSGGTCKSVWGLPCRYLGQAPQLPSGGVGCREP